MKDFAASTGRLRALSVGAKLLYSAFAVSAILGLVISWRLYGAVVGDDGPATYYAGAQPPAHAAPARGTDEGGPQLELPDEAKAPRVLTEQISERKLLEVTHFHLFSVPVYVLILGHLWLLVRMPPWLHAAGIGAGVVSSGLHLGAPWIVRGHAGMTSVVPISGALMLVVLSAMALVPTVDMWLPRAPRRAVDDPGN